MKRKITILTAIATFFMMGSTLNAQNHYCVQSSDGESHILTIDISDGSLVDSVGVQFSNYTAGIDGFNGMSQDPISGDLFVVLKDLNGDRHLGTIDPVSGDISSLGILNFSASSIAFDASGVLYATDGGGSTSLYTVSTTDGTSTLFYDFASSGDDGEAICVNTTDGLLYRYDGGSDGNFSTLDLGTTTETSIATLSGLDTWGGALYYNVASNDFTLAMGEFFYNVTAAGVATELSDITALGLSGSFKGIHKVDYSSVSSLEGDSDYMVFPNPSNGVVNIDTDKEFTLEVFDVTGSVIQNHSNVSSVKIETPGVYFFNFTEGNVTSTQKVIIK